MGFDFDIIYNPGVSNRVADALSRKKEENLTLGALLSSQSVDWAELDAEIMRDQLLSSLRERVAQGDEVLKGFRLLNGQLWYKDRLVIPKTSNFIPSLLKEYHDSPIGGHTGEHKTYARIATQWFWEGMRKQINDYVKQCSICQKQKHSRLSPAGLLQPLPIPDKVWEHISMDFVEGLPKSHGKDTVLVVVDHLTTCAHFIALKHPFTAHMVALEFIKEIVRLHGFPTSIISDPDKVFFSLFWKELFRLQGTELKYSTAYHPQTDGQSEAVNPN